MSSRSSSAFPLLPLAAVALGGYLLWRKRPAPSLSGRIAVITGGSRGLGLILARELGRDGVRLALIARDAEELRRAEAELRADEIVVRTWTADLQDPAEARHVIAQIEAHFGRIDILINNAGKIVVGPFEMHSEQDFREAMDIHLFGPLATIQAVLPGMRRRRSGRIVNISSIGGLVGVPHLSPYCASKFALTGLSETLRAELARDGIIVTTVCPGLMRTGSHWNAVFKGNHPAEFAWFSLGASLPPGAMSARRAARQIIAAMRRGDAQLVTTLVARGAVLVRTLVPALFAASSAFANRLLPLAPARGGTEHRTGWESRSRWVPSIWTRLADRQTTRNNEVNGHQPPL